MLEPFLCLSVCPDDCFLMRLYHVYSLKQALEVLIAMLVVALVFMVTAYLLKNNGSKSTSTNSEAWKGVNAVEKKSKDIDTKDRFMAPVTYEDWVIDKHGNRRAKLGSKTVNKRIGEYAHGSDIGGNTAQNGEIQGDSWHIQLYEK